MPPLAFLLQLDAQRPIFEQVTLVNIVTSLLILAGAWLAIRWSARALEFLGGRVARARFFFKQLEPVIRISVWFAAAFFIISLLAPSQETFWAGIGSMALALGLGAQDLIKNVIGGLVVLTDRPYQIGDRVKIGEAYGEIDHIGLRSTKLTTPDDTRVTIPNADILNSQVYNANSGVPDCQVVTDVYLPPDTDPDTAFRVGYEAAFVSPYLLAKKPVVVLIADQFDQRPYLRLRVKAYVHDHRFEPRMQSDITATVKREFLRLGVLQGWKDRESAMA
jgi:small-conductance mechanosensitive channel